MTSDQITNQILEEVASTWQAEGNETILTDSGFDWSPGSHTVHVRIAQNAKERNAPERYLLSVETDYLNSVPVYARLVKN